MSAVPYQDKSAEAVADEAANYAQSQMNVTGKLWTRAAILRALESAYIAAYTQATRDNIRLTDHLLARGVREVPAAYDVGFRLDERDQLPPSRESIPRPSPIEALRAAKPSRELVALLARESTAHALRGETDDAVALLILGLCVREVLAP